MKAQLSLEIALSIIVSALITLIISYMLSKSSTEQKGITKTETSYTINASTYASDFLKLCGCFAR